MGNIRTALFDHLFARRHGGVNILRIEDTDRSRLVPGCEEEIAESLRYVGVEWQEGPDVGGPFGPYRQSERKEAGIYERYGRQLVEKGSAYWAFDTPEELEAMREEQKAAKAAVGYFGGEWREASQEKVERARREGRPGVLRLKVPRGRTIQMDDAIRGILQVDSDTVDDPVLLKADGMPTYHFAAMVDDHLMEITHVFRGEEWISSAPKHAVLYEAFGWRPPVWVHVPVIKGKDGSKLSKRHGDTACLDFRRAGFLGEALANFIALIGWSPGGDEEVLRMEELAERFGIEGIQPSPGVFDLEKLAWMNGHYIRQLPEPELFDRVRSYALAPETSEYWKRMDQTKAVRIARMGDSMQRDPAAGMGAVQMARERSTSLADPAEVCDFLFSDSLEFDPKAVEKWLVGQPHVRQLFDDLARWLDQQSTVSASDCETRLRDWSESHGLAKLGPVVHPTRVALTGRTTGPGLFELMEALGPLRMAARFRSAPLG